jgi:predicted metal-dependent phosphotriesterase family hydrolase
MSGFIRTVLGDISPDQLGVTYMHEHLIIDSPIVAKDFAHIHLPNEVDAINEVNECKKVGVGAMLDCMPLGSGRDAKKLIRIAEATGVNIIAATGLHHDRYYKEDDLLEKASAEKLAELFLRDINDGMEKSDAKAGVIKVITSGPKIKDREVKLFEAAAIAHSESGAPILSHCEHGTGAIEQLELFSKFNIPLSHVTLSHTDKEADLGYHHEILSSGVFVEYDQSLRQANDAKAPSAQLTSAMVGAGFVNQIMMGTDGARRTLWSSLGGSPGLAWLYCGWTEKLIEAGLNQNNIDQIFIINPAKALAFN